MEQNVDAGVPIAPVADNKQKSGNRLKIATVISCVVAVCGIGFGVYGMMQSAQKDNQISDLKAQVEDSNEAEKVETTDENDTTTTVADSTMSNLESTAKNIKNEKYNNVPMEELFSTSYGGNIYNLYPDGKVVVRYDWTRYNDADLPANQRNQRYEDDLTSRFDSKVVDLVEGHVGNGATSTIFFLQDDGKVAWIHSLELAKNSDQPIAYVEGAQEIVRLNGNYSHLDVAGFVQARNGEIYAIKPVVENGYVVKYILD